MSLIILFLFNTVDDQKKAVDFWTKQAGFEVHSEKEMTSEASWVEVGPEGAESCLVIYPKSMMQDWAERKPSIVFQCDNVQKTFEEMQQCGVEFSQEPKPFPWGMFAIFLDSEGNWFGLRE
jgi:predicted enzyme related to lactoylglutathione lyase